MFGFAAVMLIIICFGLALPERARPAASSVSLIIEPGYTTSHSGPKRFAYITITNLSNSDFRLYGWAISFGPRPTRTSGKRMLGEHFMLLIRHSFYRYAVEAPTNGTAWSGMVVLSANSEYYTTGDKIMTWLQNSHFELMKRFAAIAAPKVPTEDLFTETRFESWMHNEAQYRMSGDNINLKIRALDNAAHRCAWSLDRNFSHPCIDQ